MQLVAAPILQAMAAYNFDMGDSQVTASDLSGYSIISANTGTYYGFEKFTDILVQSIGLPQKGHLYRIYHRFLPGVRPQLKSVTLFSVRNQPLLLDGAASVFPGTPEGEVREFYNGPLGLKLNYKGGWFIPRFERNITADVKVSLRYRPGDPTKRVRIEMTGFCREAVDGHYKTVVLQAESFNPLVTTQQTSAVYKLLNPYLQIL
jgi:hypothetical protein